MRPRNIDAYINVVEKPEADSEKSGGYFSSIAFNSERSSRLLIFTMAPEMV
jgi:hypothetical protein